jgi:WD40 repeat protein
MEAVPLRSMPSLAGHAFACYGFPAGYDTSVPAEGQLGLAAGLEWVTLKVSAGVLVGPGFSGAAVWSQDAVVALLVTRDAAGRGRVAFAVPVRVIAARSSVVADALLTALDLDPDRETHWGPRSRGVSRDDGDAGWLFTGRREALQDLAGWLAGGQPPALRVVTGLPGCGKSAVLARLVTAADRHYRRRIPGLDAADPAVPPEGAVDVMLRASGQTVTAVVSRIAGLAEVSAGTPDQLVAALARSKRRLVIVADSLDEAREPREICSLLADLARVAGARVLVGCREHLLGRLPDPDPMRLDQPPYLQRADVTRYVTALLTSVPSAQGVADLSGLAGEVSEAAAGNFLIAQLTVHAVTVGGTVSRPFPRTVRDALDRLLDALPHGGRLRDLLLPLAYARGDGLPADELWLTAVAALRRTYQRADLEDLLASPAASFLTTSMDVPGGGRRRLFHQALADTLKANRDTSADEQRLLRAWLDLMTVGPDGRREWRQAPVYLRQHGAEHAAAAGRLDELLEDPVYLAEADPDRLLSALPAATTSRALEAERLLQRVGSRLRGRWPDDPPVEERAAVLELGARQLGAGWIAERLAELPPGRRPWSVRWAHRHPVGHDRILGWHNGPVRAVAVGERDGTAVVVSGGSDGMVRVWDLRHPGRSEAEWRHGEGGVETVAIGLGKDGPIVVSGGEDGKLRRWRLADGSPLGERLDTPADTWGEVTAMAVGDLDGQPFIVAAYEHGGTVGLWDLGTGQPMGVLEWGPDFPRHEYLFAHVHGVAAGRCNGRPVIVAGHSKGAHRWVRAAGKWVAERLISEYETTWAVALGLLGGRPVAVCGADDRLTTLDMESGERAMPSYKSPDGFIIGVATGEVDGRPVAVSGNFFGTDPGLLRVWDLADEEKPLRGSLVGHYGGSKALAITSLDGRPVLVSGGFDHAVGVWDLAASLHRTPDRVEHQYVEWLQACELGGRPVVVSKSFATVSFSKSWVWHKTVNEDLEDHRKSGDRSFLISCGSTVEREDTEASAKPVIRVWDQADGSRVDARSVDLDRLGGVCAAGRVGDAVFGVSIDDSDSDDSDDSDDIHIDSDDLPFDCSVRPERLGARRSTHLKVRDLRSGAQVGDLIPIIGDASGVRHSIAIGGLGGRLAVVFCDALPGDDSLLKINWLQVWDVRAGRLAWEPLPAYHDRGGPVVRAFGTLAGQPIAVVTALNRFGIWDLQRGELIAEPPSMQGEMWLHPPVAIGELASHPVVVYSGYGRPIRIWDMRVDRECKRTIEVNTEIQAITIAPDSTIIAAGPGGALAIRVDATFFEPLPAPRERRTKAVGAEVRVFPVAGPADRAYLASVSSGEPLEKDLERYAELRRHLPPVIDEDELRSGYDRFGRLVLSGTTERYSGTMETFFAVGWPFLRMEYRPLWSGCDEDLDDAAVIRGGAFLGGRAVYIFLPDERIDLLPAENNLGWTFSWGYGGSGPGRLEISICRAAGLLRGRCQSTYPAFERWLEDLIERQHDTDRPLEIPVGLIRAKFRQLRESPGE